MKRCCAPVCVPAFHSEWTAASLRADILIGAILGADEFGFGTAASSPSVV